MKSLVIILTVLILAAAVGSCTYKGEDHMTDDDKIECGGIVDNSFSAPKKIESKDLTALDTEFFYTERYGNREDVLLNIKIERDEDNDLILSEDRYYDVRLKLSPMSWLRG